MRLVFDRLFWGQFMLFGVSVGSAESAGSCQVTSRGNIHPTAFLACAPRAFTMAKTKVQSISAELVGVTDAERTATGLVLCQDSPPLEAAYLTMHFTPSIASDHQVNLRI